MKIGILTRESISNIGANTNAVPFTYLTIFNKENFPIIIDSSLKLNDKNKQHLLNQIKDIDGFILPGGEKISDVDLFIIDYCYKNNVPLLGICLGMQVMEEKNMVKTKSLHQGVTHRIMTKEGSVISRVIGDSIVNSRHGVIQQISKI